MPKDKHKGRNMSRVRSFNRPDPEGHRCFLRFMKDLSYRHPYSFTIEDGYGSEIPVVAKDGIIRLRGEVLDDEEVLIFIARWPEEFERLTYECVSGHDSDKRIYQMMYTIRLADMSGKKRAPGVVQVRKSDGMHYLRVERDGDIPAYTLDGVKISRANAEDFIRENYVSFLTGYKSAMKALKNGTAVREDIRQEDTPVGSEGEKKLRVDIGKYIERSSPKDEKQKDKIVGKLGIEFLEGKKRKGYVGTKKP